MSLSKDDLNTLYKTFAEMREAPLSRGPGAPPTKLTKLESKLKTFVDEMKITHYR